MEQIFFLILLAAVGLVRWLVQLAEDKKNAEAAKRAAQKEPNAPIERAPAQSEEERIRKFMEALGVPTNTPPPKPPKREAQPAKPREPKRKVLPVDPFPIPRTRLPEPPPVSTPPPVVVVPPPLPAERVPAPPPPRTASTPPVATTVERAAPEFEVAEIDWQAEDPLQPSTTAAGALVRQEVVAADRSWAARLATPESLRDAIVLREIFGAPRGMQVTEERAVA